MKAAERGARPWGGAAAGRVATAALAVLAGAPAVFAQSLTGNPQPPEFSPWRIVLATLLIAALAVAVLLLRRGGGRWNAALLGRTRGADAALQVLARAGLDARSSVALVEAGGRRWLLGVGPQGPTLLAELGPPPAGGEVRESGA